MCEVKENDRIIKQKDFHQYMDSDLKGPLRNYYLVTASLKNVLQTRCKGMLLAYSPWKGYP